VSIDTSDVHKIKDIANTVYKDVKSLIKEAETIVETGIITTGDIIINRQNAVQFVVNTGIKIKDSIIEKTEDTILPNLLPITLIGRIIGLMFILK
jgi:hypothetical protein